MRIAILSRSKGLHSIRRLLQEARRAGVDCDVINPLDCQMIVGERHAELWVGPEKLKHHYDIILPRIGASITEYGLNVVQQFESLKMKSANPTHAILHSRDKMRCLQLMCQNGVRVPPTVLARSGRGLKAAIHAVGGFPVVLKLIQGTQGVGVMIVHSAVSLSSVLDTLRSLGHDVLIQKFLADSAGRDYRAFVIGNRVIAAMMRTAPEGEFRSNIHRGGEGKLIKLPASYQRTALKAAKILGLTIAGVDLMETKQGCVVLEVNSSPGFEGIERATGLNIAGQIIKHLIKSGRRSKSRKKKK